MPNEENEVQKPEPENCGAWVKKFYAGHIKGERGVVAWSAPYGRKNSAIAVSLQLPEIDTQFTTITHPAGLNCLLHEMATLLGFDYEQALRISQGID